MADKLVVTDFATMERGEMAVLIVKAGRGKKPPVSARWLPTAIELTFENPPARSMLFVSNRFRKVWTEKVYIALFSGPGEIVKGQVSPGDVVAVPLRS
ncbi:MAG: hypothetical protein EPN79_11400 [Burkholderiaceae bacterium]|nr:MAG: hypothetical protein EPN79_11400 [Burkholderiaceae bacterium]